MMLFKFTKIFVFSAPFVANSLQILLPLDTRGLFSCILFVRYIICFELFNL